tara:strand:- start:165491 stop:165988 length:498 start_codon:yes stop_codon:yes gene_type:complete
MAEFTIVENNVAARNVIADEAFMLANFNEKVVVKGRFPVGHAFKKDHFVSPSMVIIPATDILATDAGLTYREVPDTYLHKAWFMERLLPYAEDIKTARAASAKLDSMFVLLDQYKGVDVTWDKTITMINTAESIIKSIVTDSTISAANLLLPRQSNEVYRIDGAQ